MVMIYLHTAFPSLPGNPHKITRHMLNITSFYGLELYNLRLANRPFKLYLTSPIALKGLRIADVAFSIKYSDKDYLSDLSFQVEKPSLELYYLLELIRNYNIENVLVNYLNLQISQRGGILKRWRDDTFIREHVSIFVNILLNNIIHSLIPENSQYPLV
jgi:hypothetical protein